MIPCDLCAIKMKANGRRPSGPLDGSEAELIAASMFVCCLGNVLFRGPSALLAMLADLCQEHKELAHTMMRAAAAGNGLPPDTIVERVSEEVEKTLMEMRRARAREPEGSGQAPNHDH